MLLESPVSNIGVVDAAARACQSVRMPACADFNIGSLGVFFCFWCFFFWRWAFLLGIWAFRVRMFALGFSRLGFRVGL